MKERKCDHAVLYNLPSRIRAVKAGYPVYIAEGEKDADTLNKLGYTAATAGSTSDWRREYAFYFTGAKVVNLPDKDEPGMKLKDQIVKDLRHFAHSIRWTITSTADKGDVTDYLTKEDHSKKELDELIVASENRGAPWLFTDGEGARAKVKINGGILADSISRGLPYLIVRRPEEDKDDFYLYEDGVYNKCSRNKVKSLIRRYVPVGMASGNMINNVYNLLLCKDSNICTFRDLDTDENYINLKNGLYNLETRKLEPHTPKLRSTIQINCEYHPEDTARPVFDRYMNDLCSDREGKADQDKKAVIQEYMGLILSNVKVYRIKLALVLWSLLGNSGLCVVPCTNTIEQERRDSALLDKMLNERNAIFNWFLEGQRRLIDQNFKITYTSVCEEAIKDYREKETERLWCLRQTLTAHI